VSYLVDTHIFLWTVLSPGKIPKKIKAILVDPETVKYVSVVTFWEISLKFSLDKIDLAGILPDKLPEVAKDSGFEILNLDADTASSFYKLPKIGNKDPFDRMLAWQAIRSDCYLLSADKDFVHYKDIGLRVV